MDDTACISGTNQRTIKFATQVGFGLIVVGTSIGFIATGGSTSVWLPILTGTVGYFLPSPSPITKNTTIRNINSDATIGIATSTPTLNNISGDIITQ